MYRYLIFIVAFLPLVFSSCKKTQPCVDFDKVDPSVTCGINYNPVCGCDDITYQNECIAEKNGVVSWVLGPCP